MLIIINNHNNLIIVHYNYVVHYIKLYIFRILKNMKKHAMFFLKTTFIIKTSLFITMLQCNDA